MSLKSVTGIIDGIITLAVLAFCLCIWVAFGFPYYVEVGAAATCLIVIMFGAVLWNKSRQNSGL
jgi:hypothetical protein